MTNRSASAYSSKHTSTGMEVLPGSPERALAEGFVLLLLHPHLVWGCVCLTGVASIVLARDS